MKIFLRFIKKLKILILFKSMNPNHKKMKMTIKMKNILKKVKTQLLKLLMYQEKKCLWKKKIHYKT